MRGLGSALLLAAVAVVVALPLLHLADRLADARSLWRADAAAAGSVGVGAGLALGLWAGGRAARLACAVAAAACWAGGVAWALAGRAGAPSVAGCGVPLAVALVIARLPRPAAGLLRSAATGGAGPATIVGRVLLPLAAPAMAAAAALIYAAALLPRFGVVALLAFAALAPTVFLRRPS